MSVRGVIKFRGVGAITRDVFDASPEYGKSMFA